MRSIHKYSIGAAAVLLAASPAIAGSTRDVVRSGAIGAAGGAVVGAIIPGLSVGEGALIGGAGGAIVGATRKHNWHKDRHGRRYWTDNRGRRHYGR